jgi:hypothetical protein
MKYKIGRVQPIKGESLGANGFNILDTNGRPLVTIGFDSADNANAAHKLVSQALQNATLVHSHSSR